MAAPIPDSRFGLRRAPFALLVTAGLLLASTGCATGERSPSSGGASSTVLTFEMIDGLSGSYSTAYDVVNRLRPQWLRSRGSSSFLDSRPSLPVVYLDGVRHGQIQRLRDIEANALEEIRYLGASAATNRFGTGHPGGAILVVTRRGGR